MKNYHIPVLKNEVLDGLNINPSGIYVDCTLGGGGHSEQILNRLTSGRLIGIDRDSDAIAFACERLKKFNNFQALHANFKDVKIELEKLGINKLDGALIDLGVSSHQIDEAERGFSFLKDGKLDMRMDRRAEVSAYDVVNFFPEKQLSKIIFEYGEEPFAKQIAKQIVIRRTEEPIKTTFQLKDVIESSVPKKFIYNGGVTKKTFQALRIEVNHELDIIENTLKDLISMLKIGGRLCVITFHSLEDRICKNVFKEYATSCVCPPRTPVCICGHKAEIKLINRKPIVANEKELSDNSRSSCAKLRIVEKVI